jgi:hypothetical protein
MNSGRGVSAISRAIIENDLVDDYHWLPQDIAKIPYKALQMLYLVRREKVNARNAKVKIDELRQKQKSESNKGQRKRYR